MDSDELRRHVAWAADTAGFSGVVRVDVGDASVVEARGLADRAWVVPIDEHTRFGTASAAKGFTALAVLSLVEDGTLRLDTTARELLGGDLPLIADDVTVEQLLCHRSGIGDYFEEDDDLDLADHLLPVPVHTLATAEDHLTVLDGYPTAFPADQGWAYGGFVVLALLAERTSGVPYHDLVHQRVCVRAGLEDTAFLRMDELPGGVARGYLDAEGLRTNVLHLPVRGVGDGGLFTTVGDVHTFWAALRAGAIVGAGLLGALGRRRDDQPPEREGYGLGFWVPPVPGALALEGQDTGVSFRSLDVPGRCRLTVVANTSDGVWPVARVLEDRLVRR